MNNGLLPVEIPADTLARLTDLITSNPQTKVKIDLENQILSSEEESISVSFEINAFKKECLLKGLDNIDYLINMRSRIIEYENSRGGPG